METVETGLDPLLLSCSIELVVKKRKVQDSTPSYCSQWVTFGHPALSAAEKKVIVDGLELNDNHTDHWLNLTRNQFPHLSGLQSTLLQQSRHISQFLTGRKAFQIIHCRGSH